MATLFGIRRASPWSYAGALTAWAAAVFLVAYIGHTGTLLLVAPPAVVATLPVLLGRRRERLVGLPVAVALAVWSVVGITLLGLYFLPSALLIAVGVVRARGHQRETGSA